MGHLMSQVNGPASRGTKGLFGTGTPKRRMNMCVCVCEECEVFDGKNRREGGRGAPLWLGIREQTMEFLGRRFEDVNTVTKGTDWCNFGEAGLVIVLLGL